jgi:PAS domain S-box-containing protein
VQYSIRRHAIALAALIAAVLLRWLLDPLMGDALPLVTLFGAVAAAAWVGGYRPAVIVAVLGYLACNYLFIAPRGAIGPFDTATLVGLAAYGATCALIIGIGEAMRFTQQRARDQAELLRVTLGSIGDAVITTDMDGRVVSLNAVAESLTGWTIAEARGRALDDVFRIVNEATREPLANPAIQALQKNTVVGLANHAVLIARDGVERFIDDSAAPIKDQQGRVSGCVLIFRDISQRRRWESVAAGRELEARLLAAIVASSDDAIVSKSLDGIIQSWNDGAERLFGFTAEQAVGHHISLIIPPDRIAEEEKIITSLRSGQRVDHFETERRRSDGTRIQVSLTISPIKDDEGNVIGASKIARDVGERRQAEAERGRLVTLVENSTDFIGIFDREGAPLYVNPAGLKLVGLDDMTAARRIHLRDFFFPEDQARLMDEFLPSVTETGHGELEVRFRNFRTQEARWMSYKLLKLTEGDSRTVVFATVSQDITERKRLDDNLRKLAADLSEVDRRKNEFLATLSHELRNPLAPLRNMLEVLKRGNGDTAGQAVDTMERQLGQLVRLVDDLLDISRITHNRIELRWTRVDLAAAIEQAVEASRPLAEESGHRIEMTLPHESVAVNADPVRLTQIVDNLLNNSCKYTPPGGRIGVTAQREGNEAVITVADTGIGIPPANLSSIFEMFTQIDGSIERSRGGLGIGLTLVKRLVEMHGGSIEARSAGEGKGSEFIVRLPVVVEPSKAPPAARVAHEPAKTYRILVVDDNQDAATSLCTLLQITGHEALTAFDGQGALEAMEKYRPEVVLLDIGLPGISGHEVCRRARAQPWGGDMTFIALTGWGQEEDRRRTQEAGFDGHLVKPVEFAALVAQLNSLDAMRKA